MTARASRPTPVRTWASQLHLTDVLRHGVSSSPNVITRVSSAPLGLRLILQETALENCYEMAMWATEYDAYPDMFPTSLQMITKIGYVIYMYFICNYI